MNKNNANTASGQFGSGRLSGEPRAESESPESEHWRVCVNCGAPSPKTESAYTLISALHGWRLTRVVNAEGKRTVQWRCPVCWAKMKAALQVWPKPKQIG